MDHIGRETEIEVGGKKYVLSRYTREVMSRFLAWADEKLPHPLDVIRGKMEGFSEYEREIMVREAISAARLRRSLNSPDVHSLLSSPEGVVKVIHLLFAKHHPQLTEADVERIWDECNDEHGQDYLALKLQEAQGIVVHDDGGDEKKAG